MSEMIISGQRKGVSWGLIVGGQRRGSVDAATMENDSKEGSSDYHQGKPTSKTSALSCVLAVNEIEEEGSSSLLVLLLRPHGGWKGPRWRRERWI